MKGMILGSGSALAVIGLALTVGCTRQDADRVPTFPVSGTVTYNGQPVEGAQVVFVASEGGQGAVGTTDESGHYTMTTYEAGDGAAAGQYKVKITKFSKPPSQGDGASEASEEEYQGQEPYWEPENLLPMKYADPDGSGLSATVTEGENTIDFELID